jgi:hypothetical protein
MITFEFSDKIRIRYNADLSGDAIIENDEINCHATTSNRHCELSVPSEALRKFAAKIFADIRIEDIEKPLPHWMNERMHSNALRDDYMKRNGIGNTYDY